jgi:signal transduction histidine kinase
LDHVQLEFYTQANKGLLILFANQAAIAIQNARLFEQIQVQREAQIKAIGEIANSITASMKLDEVLDSILNWTISLIGEANLAEIRLLEQKTNELVVRASYGQIINEQYRHLPIGKGVTGRAALEKKTQLVPDVRQDPGYFSGLEATLSELAVPMIKEGELIGVLNIEHPQVNAFTKEGVKLAEAIAGLAAVAIKNAQQREAEIKVIKDIATSISIGEPIDRDESLSSIIDSMVPLMGKSNLFDVRLLDVETNELFVVVQRGKTKKGFRDRVHLGEGITGWVAQNKKPLLIPDVQVDIRYLPGLEGAGSELAVPMLKGDELVGVLNIEHPVVNALTESDIELAQAIASLAVVAIDNAELYAEMERRVLERTQAWQEAQEKIVASERLMVMNEVGTQFAHRMSNLAGTIPGRIKVAKQNLNPLDHKASRVIEQLDGIDRDIQQLLQASKEIKQTVQTQPAEPVAIDELLQSVINEIRSLFVEKEVHYSIRKNLSSHLLIAYVEKSKLYTVFTNIIRNAVEAMPYGGELTVSTRKNTKKGKTYVEIDISDTGSGIPASHLPKIFDPLFTTKEMGFGVGLWWARQNTKILGGDIEVESMEGRGTTFTISIPMS